jgi:hypothetical protein
MQLKRALILFAKVTRTRFDLDFYDLRCGGVILNEFDFAVYPDITIRRRPPDIPHVRHDPLQFHDPGTSGSIALGPLFHVRTFPFGISDKFPKGLEAHHESVRFKLHLYQICSLNR